MKLDRRLDSNAVETPVKFQRYKTDLKPFHLSFDTCLHLFVRRRSVNCEPENRKKHHLILLQWRGFTVYCDSLNRITLCCGMGVVSTFKLLFEYVAF